MNVLKNKIEVILRKIKEKKYGLVSNIFLVINNYSLINQK